MTPATARQSIQRAHHLSEIAEAHEAHGRQRLALADRLHAARVVQEVIDQGNQLPLSLFLRAQEMI